MTASLREAAQTALCITDQVLVDMQAQDVMFEWQSVLNDALEALRAAIAVPQTAPQAQLLEMALEALNYAEAKIFCEGEDCISAAVDAIITALAATEAEPNVDDRKKNGYAMMSSYGLCPVDMSHPDRMRWLADDFLRRIGKNITTTISAHAAEPVERQPLTREQVNACFDGQMPSGCGKSRYDIARAIEAAHGIKAAQ